MRAAGVDAWLATTGDAHLSEYLSERWQTRAWLSGFKGSAGRFVVTADQAGLWVDPRYHMRADTETAGTVIEVFKEGRPETPELTAWLSASLPAGSVVGIDPESVSAQALRELAQRLAPAGIAVKPCLGLIDDVWVDRPTDTPAAVVDHPVEFAGEAATSKLLRLRSRLAELGATSMLVTALDEVAWLLNLRGNDIPMNPVALAYCVVGPANVQLFAHEERVSPGLRAALPAEVVIRAYADVAAGLKELPVNTSLLLDPAKTSVLLYEAASHLQRVEGPSPLDAMKARKNETELRCALLAHVYDGVAVTRLLHWLSTTDLNAETELSVSEKLQYFREGLPDYRGASFDTIVGFGPNSSVGHYKLNRENPQPLAPESLLLIDCGAQFLTGTTDTTRTVALGTPTAEHKRTYTTVLKSLIALSAARFPKGTTGQKLDAIGRSHIWANDWECRHGIGHGVGSYLHVHEGPQRINKTNDVVFEVGHVNSNEPGVYFEGVFGVRLENVIAVAPAGTSVFGEFLRFDTLTPIPFDRDLIDVDLLTSQEVDWLDAYHHRVEETLSPHLPAGVRGWLAERAAPLR